MLINYVSLFVSQGRLADMIAGDCCIFNRILVPIAPSDRLQPNMYFVCLKKGCKSMEFYRACMFCCFHQALLQLASKCVKHSLVHPLGPTFLRLDTHFLLKLLNEMDRLESNKQSARVSFLSNSILPIMTIPPSQWSVMIKMFNSVRFKL